MTTRHSTRNRTAPRRFQDERFLKGSNNGYTVGRRIDTGASIEDEHEHEHEHEHEPAQEQVSLHTAIELLEAVLVLEKQCAAEQAEEADDEEQAESSEEESGEDSDYEEDEEDEEDDDISDYEEDDE